MNDPIPILDYVTLARDLAAAVIAVCVWTLAWFDVHEARAKWRRDTWIQRTRKAPTCVLCGQTSVDDYCGDCCRATTTNGRGGR